MCADAKRHGRPAEYKLTAERRSLADAHDRMQDLDAK